MRVKKSLKEENWIIFNQKISRGTMKKLKIAVVIPPFTTLPAHGQGGTERIAEGMINELLIRGHKVTLLGAGRCKTKAKFIQIFSKTISEQNFNTAYTEAARALRIETAYITKVMDFISKNDGKFDVIFNHMRGGYLMLPLAKYLKNPIISIMHLPIFNEVGEVLKLFKSPNIITISNNQRKPVPKVKYLATVYNGINISEFKFDDKPEDYFLFIGAMGEYKTPHLAIQAG